MNESSCARAQTIRRVSTLLHLLLCLGLLSVFAHGQCTAPTSTTVPHAPTLDPQVFPGASYATGTGIPGDTVVICIDGKQTNPATTTTVGPNSTFKVLINQSSLKAGQQVTAQQYTPGGAAPVYSALSNVVTVGEVSECLEALSSGECQFRVTINTSAAIGNNSQTNTNTVPNIMVTLDYQKHPPQDSNSLKDTQDTLKRAQSKAVGKNRNDYEGLDKIPWLAIHLTGKTGFTQTFAASSVQPTPTTSGGATPACPKNSQAPSSTNCTLAVSKPSFLAELGGKVGATTHVDNDGFYAEFGAGGRGSFQYLIPTNQIVQNNGASFIDLNAINSHNTVGFYEATGYAAIAQHDSLTSTWQAENTLPLLIIEGGYQNNRALQQLLPATPQISTRSRYMGKFTFNYEIPNSNHTRLSLGMEYSGGIHGGPPVLQLFVGGNLNPAKLFGGH